MTVILLSLILNPPLELQKQTAATLPGKMVPHPTAISASNILAQAKDRSLRSAVDFAANVGSASSPAGSQSGGTNGGDSTKAQPAHHIKGTGPQVALAISIILVGVVLLFLIRRLLKRRYVSGRTGASEAGGDDSKPCLYDIELDVAREGRTLGKDTRPCSVYYVPPRLSHTSGTTIEKVLKPSVTRGHVPASEVYGEVLDKPTLAVAVFIAMPAKARSQRDGHPYKDGKIFAEHPNMLGDVCLGLAEIPWDLDCHG